MTNVLVETLPGHEYIVTAQQTPSAPTPPSDAVDQGLSGIHDQAVAWLTDATEPTQLVGG